MSSYHTSVLLQEVLKALRVENNKKYIDATVGGGGHSAEILTRGAIVLGIDQDKQAIEEVKGSLKSQISNFKLTVVKGNFNNIESIARENGFEKVSGVLFDLGVSSHQLDDPRRGFSFQFDSPLDMRMDESLSVTAADLVNGLTVNELGELFIKYGEEKFAKRIAKAIETRRKLEPIITTKELAEIIAKAYPVKGKIHPATRVFQALRIAVNDELHSLSQGLAQALRLLEKQGRVVVISFHSLEDRIVKQTFLQYAEEGLGIILTKKPIVPSKKELEDNYKSRSAKMRVFEKL